MVALTGRDNVLTAVCRSCHSSHDLVVNIADVRDWKSGKYIQDAMPYLSADQRELLISGTCGKCWKEMFGDCEE